MWTLWDPEQNVFIIMFCLYTNALFRCVLFLTQNHSNKHVDSSSTVDCQLNISVSVTFYYLLQTWYGNAMMSH